MLSATRIPFRLPTLCRPQGWGWPMIVLAIGLILTLVDRRQLLQARAPACYMSRVRAAADALTALCSVATWSAHVPTSLRAALRRGETNGPHCDVL